MDFTSFIDQTTLCKIVYRKQIFRSYRLELVKDGNRIKFISIIYAKLAIEIRHYDKKVLSI